MTISAITYVFNGSVSSSNTITATPLGYSAGDLLVAAIFSAETIGPSNVTSVPAGWTLWQPTGGDGSPANVLVATKVAAPADVGATFTFKFNTLFDVTISVTALQSDIGGHIVQVSAALANVATRGANMGASAAELICNALTGAAFTGYMFANIFGTMTAMAMIGTDSGGYGDASDYLQQISLYVGATLATTGPYYFNTPVGDYEQVYWANVAFALNEVSATPLAPTLNDPAAGEYRDATQQIAFGAVYNPTNGQPMSAYSLRLKATGGSYYYWTGSAWSTTLTWVTWTGPTVNPGGEFFVLPTIGATHGPVNSGDWDYSFATQEASAGLQGPFASDALFHTAPAMTLTYLGPTGTLDIPEPTLRWSFVSPSGATPVVHDIVLSLPGEGNVYISGQIYSSATSYKTIRPLANGTYTATIIVEDSNDLFGTCTGTFTILVAEPLPPSFSVVANNDLDTGAPQVQLSLQNVNNLLDQDDAGLNNSTGTWGVGGNLSNLTVALGTAQSLEGGSSMAISASSSGLTGSDITNKYPCPSVGLPISMQMGWYVPTGGPTAITTSIIFYNAAGSPTSFVTASHTGVVGSWTVFRQNNVLVPANAVSYTIGYEFTTTAGFGGVQAFLDEAGVFQATTSPTWTPGGYVAEASLEVQQSTDGINWTDVSGLTALPIPNPPVPYTLIDRSPPPGNWVYYRAQISALADDGLTYLSAWGYPGPVMTDAHDMWWLQIPGQLDSAVGFHGNADPQFKPKEVATVNYPLGRNRPVKMTDGVKGRAGILSMRVSSLTGQGGLAMLRNLIEYDGTLLLQDPSGVTTYIAHDPQTDPIESPIYNTMTAPTQFAVITFNYIEVTPPT